MPARKLGTTTVTTTKTVQKGVEGIDCVNTCAHLGYACNRIWSMPPPLLSFRGMM